MKLSIVIPVYHEEKNITTTLQKLNRLVHTPHETLILYDSAKDPTVPIVKKYMHAYRKQVIRLVKNNQGNKKGVMNAIKTGFAKAKGNAVVVLMADLSDDISQIDRMYQLFQDGYDIVCASRYMKGGKKIGGPLIKTVLSRLAGITLHHLFGIPTHDSTNAFKLYNRKIFSNITVESTGGFEYSLEIVLKAHKLGYAIVEIPTVWRDRLTGASNFKILSWLPQYFKWYMQPFGKIIIILSLLLLSLGLAFASFWRILSFYFFQDDYQFLWYARFHPLQHFLTFRHPGTPLEALLLTPILGFNPVGWEIIGILLKVFCAYVLGIFLFQLTKSKVAGFLASIFFAVSYIGMYAMNAFNYHVPILVGIVLLISFIFLIKSFSSGTNNIKYFLAFLFFAIFLDPARALVALLILPFLAALFSKAKHFAQVKKLLVKLYGIFFLVGIPLLFFWYKKATAGVGSWPEIFLKGMLVHPLNEIVKLKDIGNYFATVGNVYSDMFYSLRLIPPKYETAMFSYALAIFGVVLLAVSIFLFWQFLKKRKQAFGIITFLIFWTYLFYLPNFLQEPRAAMGIINHYLFLSSIGYIGLVAYLFSFIKQKWLIGLLSVTFILVNIYKANYLLALQLPYRESALIKNSWDVINRSVLNSRSSQTFLFTGDVSWANDSILAFGSYHFLLLKNDPIELHLPLLTIDEPSVLARLCKHATTPQHISTWNVQKSGELTNISTAERKHLQQEMQSAHCQIN